VKREQSYQNAAVAKLEGHVDHADQTDSYSELESGHICGAFCRMTNLTAYELLAETRVAGLSPVDINPTQRKLPTSEAYLRSTSYYDMDSARSFFNLESGNSNQVRSLVGAGEEQSGILPEVSAYYNRRLKYNGTD
jgi:hypothetical protein